MDQGDILLYQTTDNGEIDVENGVVLLAGGLDTAVYLALFGGNETDDGLSLNSFTWWANTNEIDAAKKYRSETQFLLKSLPATTGNLQRINDAIMRDLAWLISEKVASSIETTITIPTVNQISITIDIIANGEESTFNFVNNWKVAADELFIPIDIGELQTDVPPIVEKLIELQLIVPSDATAFDYNIDGVMSADGSLLLMSAPTADHSTKTDTGAAWIFERTGDAWGNEKKVIATDPLDFDKFGHAVSISGDGTTLAIASHENNEYSTDGGAVYIFTEIAGVWVQHTKLTPSVNPVVNDRFGFSISLDYYGNTIVIGAPFEELGGTDIGAAYVFVRVESAWYQSAKLTHNSPNNTDTLGYSAHIAPDGQTIFIGATLSNTVGGVFVYKIGSGWSNNTENQLIQHPGGVNFDEFGAAVNSFYTFGGTPISSNFDGTELFIGAYGVDGAGTNRGAVFHYRASVGVWSLIQTIEAPSVTQNYHFFGYSVSVDGSGNILLISAQSDDSGLNNAGRAFMYEFAGGEFVECATKQAEEPQAEAFFGNRVSVSYDGKYAVIMSSDYDNGVDADTGAGYAFKINTTRTPAAAPALILPLLPNYQTTAVDFPGFSSNYNRDGDLTGAADSKKGTFSAWIKIEGGNGTTRYLYSAAGSYAKYISVLSDNKISLILTAFGGGLNIKTSAAFLASADWIHVLASWDVGLGLAHLYINDVSDLVNNSNDWTIDHSQINHRFFSNISGNDLHWNGCVSDFYMNFFEYIDFSVEANRRKFIDASGKPAYLGFDGSLPTGTQPIVFLKGDATDFHNNLGSGGTLIKAGSVTDCDTSPSEDTYTTSAVEFDGDLDYLRLLSDLTGNVDGQKGIISCWIKIDSTGVGAIQKIYETAQAKFNMHLTTGGALSIAGSEVGTATVLMSMGSAAALPQNQWVHILASWDVGLGVEHLYIDDVAEAETGSVTANLIDYTRTAHAVGSSTGGSQEFKGCLSDFYINFAEYLDLSVTANRRKFINASFKPVYLGDTGSVPTGTAPIMFFRGDLDTYPANVGTGDAFTDVSALSDCIGTPDNPAYRVPAVELDGSADWFTRGADLTGNADGQKGILSMWFMFDFNGLQHYMYSNDSGRINIRKRNDNILSIQMSNTSGTIILNMESTVTLLKANGWINILASWDQSGTGNAHLYINDVDRKSLITDTIGTIEYTTADHAIAALVAGGSKHDGCMSDFYFNRAEYLDFSIEANRRKFIDASGRWVDPGATGQLPTGTQPIILLSGDKTTYPNNLGSGGAFTDNGTIDDCVSSPSD